MAEKLCALIPVYNNHMTIERVVNELRPHIEVLIIVDDASDDSTEQIVDRLANENPESILIVHHAMNLGKGGAVQSGLRLAAEKGFDSVLQVDADGQHDLADVPSFLDLHRQYPGAMIMGAPVFDDTIPAIRKYGRKLTHLMIALEAGSNQLPDAMCGFRLYPVDAILSIGSMSNRMSFDPEVMIRAHWSGVSIKTVPTRVRYLSEEEGGVSHFRMVHDNIMHTWVHSCLLLQAPYRWAKKWLKSPSHGRT